MFPVRIILAFVLALSMASCNDALVSQSGSPMRKRHYSKPVRGKRSRKQVRKSLGYYRPELRQNQLQNSFSDLRFKSGTVAS